MQRFMRHGCIASYRTNYLRIYVDLTTRDLGNLLGLVRVCLCLLRVRAITTGEPVIDIDAEDEDEREHFHRSLEDIKCREGTYARCWVGSE